MKIKNKKVFITGIVLLITGISVLSVFGYKKISRELYKKKLMKECPIIEIPNLDIKAPILEGTDNETLKYAAGHFEGKGEIGKGNYCLAGHNSTIYACIFDDLSKIKVDDKIYIYDNDKSKTKYTYITNDIKTVSPSENEILSDFGDNRITIITCTDDGKERFVVTGSLTDNN